jgi:hypothetical protein
MPKDDDRLDQYLDAWRRDLIDLSRRNRLINLPLGGRVNIIEIKAPDFSTVLQSLSKTGSQGWRFHYPPVADGDLLDDPTLQAALEAEDPDLTDDLKQDELLTNVNSAALLSTRLRTLASKATMEFIDRGLRVLYLTVGVMRWSDGDPKDLSSPLVLIPVQLDRASPRDPYRLVVADDEWVANPALAAKLLDEFDIVLPEFDQENIEGYLTGVAKAIKGEGWAVERTCTIATLSFTKETIYRDLLENDEEIKASEVIKAITIGGPSRDQLEFEPIDHTSDELDRTYPPEVLSSILDADGTQRSCIVAAKEGRTFVMDGPPGSGKSQTISNIIAELLADGKTILFVSEKVAALEVVKKRLDQSYLGEYVLELHSHKATRKTVALELGKSLRKALTVPRIRYVDERQLGEQRRELSDYAAAINEARYLAPHIRNLHDAIGRCGQLAHLPTLPCPSGIGDSLSADRFHVIITAARNLANSWGPVELGEDFLWRELTSAALSKTQVQVNSELDEALRHGRSFQDYAEGFADRLSVVCPGTLTELERLIRLSRLLGSRPEINLDWLHASDLDALVAVVRSLAADTDTARGLREGLVSRGFDVGTLPVDPGPLQHAIQQVANFSPETLSADVLDSARQASETLAEASAQLAGEVATGAELLGLNIQNPSSGNAASLIELLDLADRPHRPVESWLNEARIRQVQVAIRAVQPLVEEWQATESRLAEHFNDNIRTVDIAAFYDSESDVQPKLGRLSGRGRQNRKQLIACSRNEKITKDIVALLPVVRSWRSLTERLDSLEEASVLGDYFAGPATDLNAVRNALEAAERALVLAGPKPDTERLARVIGRDALSRQEVKAHRARLLDLFGYWQTASGSADLLQPVVQLQSLSACEQEHRQAAGKFSKLAQEMHTFILSPTNTVASALSVAESVAELVALENHIERSEWGSRLEPLFNGLLTDWQRIIVAIEWVSAARECITGNLGSHTVDALAVLPGDLSFEQSHKSFISAIDRILAIFEPDYQPTLCAILSGDIEECLETLETLRNTSGDIAEWRRFAQSQTDLRAFGFGELLNFMLEERIPSSEVEDLTERTMVSGWVDELLLADPRTRVGRRQDRDEVLKRFRELDRDLHLKAGARVIEVCNNRRPSAVVGEFQIIDRESTKKTKHMPIRDLLSKSGGAALDLKPCFMMSPLSVSQFLPADLRFDCVIFDEASQVKPADAINAIYRGRQIIIAGDERQLPPTSFFDRGVQDDDVYDEDEVDEFESILSLSKAGIPQLPLRWHYRSRHESLISFSNREYYDSELITFPGAVQESDELGIHFEYVDNGVYSRGGGRDNVVEARRVVERVMHHASIHRDRSVGVIAFSDAQASRITVELEAVRRDRPDLDDYFGQNRLDGFFIKNLESVQGDERDIIIFSIGYGRDEYGKFTMNFGPVGKEGGQRRLNVAATRARQRVEVVASVRAGDFQVTSNPRLQSLKRYLDYAERGIAAFADDGVTGGEPDSPFEEDVISVLRDLGHVPRPQVGQAGYRIDIGIVHPSEPGRYILGVECDGASYHSSRVARDRDRLRQSVLEGLGWTIHRIWSTSWFRDRASEIERLKSAIDESLKVGQPTFTDRGRRTLPVPQVVEVVEEVAPWANLYSTSGLSRIRPVTGFEDANSGPAVRALIKEVLAVLEPAHIEQIEAAVKQVQKFTTMSAARKQSVHMELRVLIRQRLITKDRHGFYWQSAEPAVSVRSGDPNSPNTVRKPSRVSPDEVKLAMFWLVRDGRSVEPEQLVSQTARLFGWKRTGSAVEALLDKALRELKRKGDLSVLPDGRLSAEDRLLPDLS